MSCFPARGVSLEFLGGGRRVSAYLRGIVGVLDEDILVWAGIVGCFEVLEGWYSIGSMRL